MNRHTSPSWSRVALAVAAALAVPPGVAVAAGAPAAGEEEVLEQVIVTGSRRAERSVLESNVPVDVVSEDDLFATPAVDLNNKLQAVVPSYSVVRTPPADGAIFVRPAKLRNLSPDHTLVLVNGKRFHRSAFVDVTSRGAHAPDISLIPAAAFRQVEVLRDGAAAQYGSDAIAGVVNFILDDRPGFKAYTQYGEYDKGDGENLQVGASGGFALGATGHLNVAAEYFDGKPSNNGHQRPLAQAIIDAGQYTFTYPAPIGTVVYNDVSEVRRPVVQRYGQPDLETFKIFANAGFELANGSKVYAFGNFADFTGANDFNWRGPGNAGGVTGASSVYNRSKYQADGSDASGTWTAIYPDWDLHSVFPGGFTPLFGQDSRDYSITAGIKGDAGGNLGWDFSAGYGSNKIEYWLKETINASLGPESPTEFYDGARESREFATNLDFVYQLPTSTGRPVNIGFGLEYRRDQYVASPGDEASYVTGPLADLPPASNGFVGIRPVSAGKWKSNSKAAYIDVDADLTERFNVNVAWRIEDFSLFGTTDNGKLAARFEVNDAVSLRGAVSTGFHAPTVGQQNLTDLTQNPNIFTQIVETNGIFPSTSAPAALFGGKALTPEESTNISLGFVWAVPGFSFTVDAYQIKVEDRLGITQRFFLNDAQRQQLADLGVPNANGLTSARFFANGYDTRTRGVDLVATTSHIVGPGRLGFTFAGNWNKTVLTKEVDVNPDPAVEAYVLSDFSKVDLLNSIPRFSANLSADYGWTRWKLTGRVRHYGGWDYPISAGPPAVIQFDVGSETFLDLIGNVAVTDNVDVSVGIENVLDNYGDRATLPVSINNGRTYVGATPFENDGRRFYARVGIRF